MTAPESYSYTRYRDALRTIDDRGRHRPTVDQLRDRLRDRLSDRLRDRLRDRAADDPGPVQVLDVGCGTGTTLRRLLEWNVLPETVVYTGLDVHQSAIPATSDRIAAWATESGYSIDSEGVHAAEPMQLQRGDSSVIVSVRETAATAISRADVDREWDLLVADDLPERLAMDATLPDLLDLVPGGLAYLPATADGHASFFPWMDPDPADQAPEGGGRATGGDTDAPVERTAPSSDAIWSAADARPDDDHAPDRTHAGRALLERLSAADADVISVGGGDRVVRPRGGEYPADEAYYLHHTIEDVADAAEDRLPAERVRAWAEDRHASVAAGDLWYVAHGLDVLAAVEG